MTTPFPTSRVAELMSKPVVTVTPSDSILYAVSRMVENNVGCVIVIQGSVVGIITERDILKQTRAGIDFMQVPAREVMSKPVVTATVNDDPLKALSIMAEKKIRRLPVLHERKLVGIVTERDLVRWILTNPDLIIALLSESALPTLSKESLAAFFSDLSPRRGLQKSEARARR